MSSIRAYRAEPAVAGAPRRVWRDWVVVALAVISAVLETSLRRDLRWPVASLAVCLVMVPTLLVRRTRPLLATAGATALAMLFNLAVWISTDEPGGLTTGAFVLINIYALYRWGSGADGFAGAAPLLALAVIGNITDAESVSDVIGGLIVLTIPVELGLIVRYRSAAALRRTESIRSREREQLARELHDTVAHHVSAIAVQAQAGKVVAATRPDAAIEVLAVIEREASRTLAEMRAIVGALRGDDEAELTPRQGLADLARLALRQPIRVDTRVDAGIGQLPPQVDAALFRIAQESITNAVRHARRASCVLVCVEPCERGVRISVTDDGEPAGEASGAGYGLLGMAERTELLGGTLTAGPRPGSGWQVIAEIPVGAAVERGAS